MLSSVLKIYYNKISYDNVRKKKELNFLDQVDVQSASTIYLSIMLQFPFLIYPHCADLIIYVKQGRRTSAAPYGSFSIGACQ
jgi:hypothetical protein